MRPMTARNTWREGTGWYSFDHHGVHFVGLVNSAALEGMGKLGAEQLAWLKDDLSGHSASTPIVLFAHIPLWAVYPEWGWGTADSEEALGYVKRFGSVTVLNGHIHQTMQKVERNVRFHTAMSTAFPQPAPGKRAVPWSVEGAGRETARSTWHQPGRVRGASTASGDCRFDVGVTRCLRRVCVRRWPAQRSCWP
jgi:3',5'-cyclic AMP phosphodiesterase CpdA